MGQGIEITPLSRHPAALDQLALWHHQECQRQGLSSSLERRRAYLAKHLCPEPLPLSLVALDSKGEPIGCVSLVRYNSAASPQPRVWLSNLYVLEAYRRRGLGQRLLDSALQKARQLKLTQIWLFTDRQFDYYARRGWQAVGQACLGPGGVQIMTFALQSKSRAG